MAKVAIVFECASCGYQSPKWLGNCPRCKTWNSFTEMAQATRVVAETAAKGVAGSGSDRVRHTAIAQKINDITADSMTRTSTQIAELDRVLGGGMVAGMVVLVGGDPGIGKSTLMSQLAALSTRPTLYVSSEETAAQMKIRINRLQLQESSFHVLNNSELEQIMLTLRKLQSRLVVIDSIQMLHSLEYSNAPGSAMQLRVCCQSLINWARTNGAVLFLVVHVTKEGSIAGPKLIEHLVDTVLYFDDVQEQVRFLRASKNRFGNLQEVGIFTLEEHGLIPITDPSGILRSDERAEPTVGAVVVPVYEGSRVLLIEIQALTIPSSNSNARVYSDIIDPRRVSRIAAVLERQVQVPLSRHDIYLNVAGGIRVNEVALDLGIAHALHSAATDSPPPPRLAVCGEVSLAGEVRPVTHMARRVRTAQELGYKRVIGPAAPSGGGGSGGNASGASPVGDEARNDWRKCATVTESLRYDLLSS